MAKAIAEEFNLTHLSGGDILKEFAQEEGFESGGDDWWDTEEGMNFLNKRQEDPKFDKKVDDKLKKYFLDEDTEKDNLEDALVSIKEITDPSMPNDPPEIISGT